MKPAALNRSIAFLDSWLDYQERQRKIPGFAIAVACGDEIVFSKALGYADLDSGERLTTDHLFNLGSQAKMITATLVMQLAEQGMLELDDRVANFLPWLKLHSDKRFQTITVRQLLWHGGGIIRDGRCADFWQMQAPFPDVNALKELIFEAALASTNGERRKYSNLGYALLGQLIEAVTDTPYEDNATRNIFQPLEMSATSVYSSTLEPLMTASYTRVVDGQRKPIPKCVPTNTFSSVAGWYGTVNDCARFMMSMLSSDKTILKLPSKHLLTTEHQSHWQPTNARGSDYGLGFEIQRYGTRQTVGHSGGFIGYRSCSYGDQTDQLAVIVLANAMDAPVTLMTQGIFGVFDHFDHSEDVAGSSDQRRFNVRLRNLWETMEIVSSGSRIVCIDPDNWDPFSAINEELVAENETTLRIDSSDDMHYKSEHVTLEFNENDRVERVNYAGTTAYPEDAHQSDLELERIGHVDKTVRFAHQPQDPSFWVG